MHVSEKISRAEGLQVVFGYLATERDLVKQVMLLRLVLSKLPNQVIDTSIDNTRNLLQQHKEAHIKLADIRRTKEAYVRMLQKDHLINQQESALYLYTPKC